MLRQYDYFNTPYHLYRTEVCFVTVIYTVTTFSPYKWYNNILQLIFSLTDNISWFFKIYNKIWKCFNVIFLWNKVLSSQRQCSLKKTNFMLLVKLDYLAYFAVKSCDNMQWLVYFFFLFTLIEAEALWFKIDC